MYDYFFKLSLLFNSNGVFVDDERFFIQLTALCSVVDVCKPEVYVGGEHVGGSQRSAVPQQL